MLSLFSSNKGGDRGDRNPKPKPKPESFDFDSFLTSVAPTTKDFTISDPNPKQNKKVEEDRITHVPSKSALKVMDEVHRKSENVPKDLEKASRKISKSIKQLEVDHQKAQDFHKINQNRMKKAFEEHHKVAYKPRPDAQLPRKPDESTIRPGHNSYNDSSTSFSRMPAPSYRKESSPPGSKSHFKKSIPRPREDDDNERLELPEDFDLLMLQKNESYDPLDFTFAPNTMKRESSEIYDPLNVSIRKTSDEQPMPVRPSKIEPTELIGKRSSGGDSERYAPEITKKLKTDEQRRRFDAIFIGTKNPPPKQHHNGHNGQNNPHMKPRKYTHESEEEVDDESDPDDEARRELAQMMGNYRKKVQMRKPFEDDVDDMEAGFDEVEREERISRHIGNKEDQEQLRYIQMEEMNERRGKIQ